MSTSDKGDSPTLRPGTDIPGVEGLCARIPAPALLIGSGISQYTGAAVAVGLFTVISPLALTWWRIVITAVLLLAWRQPWRKGLALSHWGYAMMFGVAMGAMSLFYYEAIARIPMGTVVSLGFLGPVAVAVIGGKGWTIRVAVVLAATGVGCIGGFAIDWSDSASVLGLVCSFASGSCWALVIILGRRVSAARDSLTSLSIACAAAAVAGFPLAVTAISPAWGSLSMALLIVAIAISSTLIPSCLELFAIARLRADSFALLAALLPATSAIIGCIALHQIPTLGELLGLICISVAVGLAGRSPA